MTPETPATRGNEPAHRRLDPSESCPAESRKPVLLVVDDNAVFRKLVTSLVQREGYSVLSAADGQEALELSREYSGPIDLVITDVEMPRLNGTDLCTHLFADRPGIRALLMSGSSVSKSVGRHVNLPFLPKPFDGETLKTRVRAILAA